MDEYLSVLMSLAWPVVTLAIALIFRKDVTRALGRVGRLRYRDLEVTFHEELCQAEELASKLPPPPPASSSKDSIVLEIHPAMPQPFIRPFAKRDFRQSLRDLAERSPRQAIEAAWNLVDRGTEGQRTEAEARLIESLKNLHDRSTRVGSPPPSVAEARRFVELACPLATRIETRV